MNKVLFVCLVSLSICFSSPTAKEEKPGPTTSPALPVTEHATEAKAQTSANGTTDNKTTEHATSVPPHQNAPPAPPAKTGDATPSPVHPETVTPKNETAAPNIDNKTDNKTAKPDEKKPEPSKEKPTSTVAPVKPDDKKKEEATTVKPATTEKAATTEKPTTPKTDDKNDITLQSRAFDGPSFVGGIILTLGMLAVGFIGFRYYRSQTERNYHTL